MREHKFRAWDKQRNRMSKPFKLGDQFLEWEDGIDFYMPLEFFLSKERGIIMQWTGLKDKNFKEIYEGDIINGQIYIIDLNGGGNVFAPITTREVYFQSGHFRCKPMEILNKVYKIEVIGNIYENPELLS